MFVEIVTPDEMLFSGGDVHLVQLPGVDGSFEILNHHAPLISILKKGRIKVEEKGKPSRFFKIKGGVIEVLQNKVLILAE